MNIYGSSSKKKLLTGSEELQWIAHRAISLSNTRFMHVPDFGISEVLRTAEEQFDRFKQGRALINNEWVTIKKSEVVTYCDGYDKLSFHQSADALDFFAYIDGKASYSIGALTAIASCFMEAASEANMQFEWGGNYQNFFDGCHFNLVRNTK